MPFTYTDFLAALTPAERNLAPKNFFTEGNTSYLVAGLKVAVVGSRKASAQGLEIARFVTEALVSHGVIVVSGLAEGIDTIAHETAIRAGGKTIAVLGTPLDMAYPAGNAQLLATIKAHHLAVSQFPFGYPKKKENFPLRNRTIALLCNAAIIVEAAEHSGTRHLIREALRLRRPVSVLTQAIQDNSLFSPEQMANDDGQELSNGRLPAMLENLLSLAFRSASSSLN